MSVSEFYRVEDRGNRYLVTLAHKARGGRPTTTVHVLNETRSPSRSEIARVRDALKGQLPTWKREPSTNNR